MKAAKILAPVLKRAFGMPEEMASEIFDNPGNAIFMLFEKEVKIDDPDMELQEGEVKITHTLFRDEGKAMVLIAAINSKFEIVRKIKLYDLGKSLKPPK